MGWVWGHSVGTVRSRSDAKGVLLGDGLQSPPVWYALQLAIASVDCGVGGYLTAPEGTSEVGA